MEFKKSQAIKTSVVACVIDEQERVLLTRRCIEPFCSLWVMPGGKIDHGEPILKALHREVREEVGIDVQVEGLIDVFEHIGVGTRNDHFVILYYRAAPLSYELLPNGEECTEAIWASKKSLPQLPMPPGGRHILSQIFPDLSWHQKRPQDISLEEEIPGGDVQASSGS